MILRSHHISMWQYGIEMEFVGMKWYRIVW